MAKRRLTDQQKRRIQATQQARLQRSRQKNAAAIDDTTLGPEQRGLIFARFSRHVDVKALEGDSKGKVIRSHLRTNIASIAVGDFVAWRETPEGQGVVVAVEERQSLIERPDGLGKLKPIAANIDQVFVVFAVLPEPHPNLIDRYLIAAENSGIEAKLVVNKTDLLDENDKNYDFIQTLLTTYRNLGYDVFEISCENNDGMEAIRSALAGKTSIFAGQSGVGKTSMINALMPEIQAKVGALSEHVIKGRHTTTTSTMFELDGDGLLIDSPGIREFHLSHFNKPQIFAGYRELQPLLGLCRFRDCQHKQEPGCVVQALLETDDMAQTRKTSLSYILNSLDLMA
ncbi:MAG: small ribosomal subunit biogenesis GTPase RsgA [Pseudomonadales bacterium]|nr:small ribosomal subunit biogenesis GTPase RsgA [Pseudomonadales bacterium]